MTMNLNAAHLRFVTIQLLAQCVDAQVGSLLKSCAFFLHNQIVARNIQVNFHHFILRRWVVVYLEKNIGADDVIEKLFQFVQSLLNEVHQLLIYPEIDGLHLHFHNDSFMAPRMGAVIHRFDLLYGIVRIHLRGRQAGMTQQLFYRLNICTHI